MLQITFKDVPRSDALAHVIRDRAEKLGRFCGGRVISCRVVVHEPHRRPHPSGNLFAVSINVTVPGAELAVSPSSSERGKEHAFDNPFVAVQNAFDAIERQLREHRAIQVG